MTGRPEPLSEPKTRHKSPSPLFLSRRLLLPQPDLFADCSNPSTHPLPAAYPNCGQAAASPMQRIKSQDKFAVLWTRTPIFVGVLI